MRAILLMSFWAMTPNAWAAAPLTLAAPGLGVVGLSPERAVFFNESLATQLTRLGVRVTTARDMQQLLGMERQRVMLGCEVTACMSELAAAMGTDGVVTGDVARLGESWVVNVKVISGRDGKTVSTYQGRVSTEEGVVDELERAARVLATESANALQRTLTARPASPLRPVGVAVGAVGLAAAATGGVLLGLSQAEYAAIPAPGSGTTLPVDVARAHATTGATLQTGGWVALAGGVAVLAAGIALFVAGGSSAPVTASAWVGAGSGGLVVQGSF